MFSSSVRRVAFGAPQNPIAALATSAPRAVSQSCYRGHQRRFSSSKPSSPADGSNGIVKGQTPPARGPIDHAKSASEEKKSQRSGKRRTKNGADTVKGAGEATQHLPNVPTTHHIPPAKIAASDFFSLYRPISLTHNFPQPVTTDAFATIFTHRPKSSVKPNEVIRTLSSAVQSFESSAGQAKQFDLGPRQAEWNSETDELKAVITAEHFRDSEPQSPPSQASMEFPHHILRGQYQPFSPPPPPVPMDSADFLSADAEASEAQEPQHKRYTALLTIDQSTDEYGEVTISAHSTDFHEDKIPTRFLERMQIRQEQSRERATENGMLAISVKRQRKLKMKKHKYKKLMRKTRNLRRRLDRN